MTYEAPSDHHDDACRQLRTAEIGRLIPGLTTRELATATNRWCLMLGLHISTEEVAQGTFEDFRLGLGFGSGYDTDYVRRA